MKIQALYDLQQEINRLYIAGSKFAKNDPRLTKQLPVLLKLGEKAPVFKKLAQNIEELIQSDIAESADKLLNTGILLYSVLYTQGEMTEEDVELSELQPSFKLKELNTTVSYLELKPVIEALTSTRQGRMAVIEKGFKQGIFNDFRTFEYLDKALGDKYSELADYIEKTVIPTVGTKIVPFVRKNFSYEGRTEDIRRFRLLYQFSGVDNNGFNITEMIQTILEGSSVNLQAEAIGMLADDPSNEELIIRLADDKHKPVREAAYMALAKLDTKTSLEKLIQVFIANKSNTNLPGIITAIRSGKISFYKEDIFNTIQSDFETFISMESETDDKKLVAALDKLSIEFPALEDKKDDYIIGFLSGVLTNEKFNNLVSKKKGILGDTAKYLVREICINLGRFKKDVTRDVLKNLFENPLVQKNWWEYVSIQYFPVAAEDFGKEKIYELFKDCYRKGKLMNSAFIHAYAQGEYNGYITWEDLILNPENLDKRWFELFLEKGEKNWNSDIEVLFLLLAGSGSKSEYSHKALKSYMQEVIKNKRLPYHGLFNYATDKLMESGLSTRFELLTAALENNRYYNYDSEIYKHIAEADYLKDFPKEYAKRYHTIYQKSNVDSYLEIAQKIENNPGKIQKLIGKLGL